MSTKVCCNYCDKQYADKSGLRRHLMFTHRISSYSQSLTSFACQENGCHKKCVSLDSLKSHLIGSHNLKFPEETHLFSSEDEFKEWFERTQKVNGIVWVKVCGKKRSENRTVQYMYCSRSGMHRPASRGVRTPRQTSKIGFACTATLVIIRRQLTDVVEARACFVHYGHSVDLEHLRSRSQDSLNPFRNVPVEGIQNSLGRLTKKMDICKFQNAFGMYKLESFKDDAASLTGLVQELEKAGDCNPILARRFENESSTRQNSESSRGIFIVFQHPSQAQMMKEFGGKVICMDTIQGTNDVLLISILVMKEMNEAIPVAWCIANKNDRSILTDFLNVIKINVGVISPRWFMSDDAGHYYNVWVSVFGQVPNKLHCPWAVFNSWKKQIGSLKDKSLGKIFFEELVAIQKELNQKTFNVLIQNFITKLQSYSNTENFLKYITNYFNRPHEWASCYYGDFRMTTIMYLKAFHGIFKDSYLNAKRNKRLSICIAALLSFIRVENFEQMMKHEELVIRAVSEIKSSHDRSLSLSLGDVKKIQEHQYLVEFRNEFGGYDVCFLPKCDQQCGLVCTDCNICVHESICSCYEYMIHGILCKHIHLAQRYKQNFIEEIDSFTTHISDPLSMVEIVLETSDINKVELENTKNELNCQLDAVKTQIDLCNDVGVLNEIKQFIQSMSNFLNESEINSASSPQDTIAANETVQTDSCLYSVDQKTSMEDVVEPSTDDNEIFQYDWIHSYSAQVPHINP